MIDAATLDAIADAIVARLAPIIRQPQPDDLMDAAEVALYLHSTPRVIAEKWAKQPGFPAPVRRKTATGKTRSFWFRRDIAAYAKSLKGKR